MNRKYYVGRDENGKLALYSEVPRWLSIYREFTQSMTVQRDTGLFTELNPLEMSEEECPRGEYVEVKLKLEKAQ